MNVLFVHNNFPAQYRNLVAALTADPANRVAAIGSPSARELPGVEMHRYTFAAHSVAATHPFARRFALESARAEQVLYAASALARSDFSPDTIVVHSGWGENLPLRAVFPNARLINYCEFYYRPEGQDVGFDPDFPILTVDGTMTLAMKNATMLLGLVDCDAGLSPTAWQRSTFPPEFHPKIAVAHEGIDTDAVAPDPSARFEAAPGRVFTRGDEVVTFVSRHLEPLRGFHAFMRALPQTLRRRPNAHVLIVGGDQAAYGPPPPAGTTWKTVYLDEVKDDLDLSRVHFLGQIDYARYLDLLRVSAVHVYLTYPFVLSWSFLEAMACECLVVGSDVAPVREVVDGTNGRIVPFFDTQALTETMVEALERPKRFDDMRKAARRTIVERYDARRICVPAGLRLLEGA